MTPKTNILVAFDFRPESEAALDYALGVGKKLSAIIHVLYIPRPDYLRENQTACP